MEKIRPKFLFRVFLNAVKKKKHAWRGSLNSKHHEFRDTNWRISDYIDKLMSWFVNPLFIFTFHISTWLQPAVFKVDVIEKIIQSFSPSEILCDE